jgi:hypothetical protein
MMPSHKLRNLIVLLVRSFEISCGLRRAMMVLGLVFSSKSTLSECLHYHFAFQIIAILVLLVWDVSLIRFIGIRSRSRNVSCHNQIMVDSISEDALRLSFGELQMRFNYEGWQNVPQNAGHFGPFLALETPTC